MRQKTDIGIYSFVNGTIKTGTINLQKCYKLSPAKEIPFKKKGKESDY
jgi:hypothetical protein